VSHRWEVPEQPDVEGKQLEVIKAYLHAHLDIEWVWFDFSTMPQGENRTPYEKAEFSLMLTAITDFYLTARVLILLDGSYASRFWTLTEAWCSMQMATPMGLRPATEDEHRYTIQCIHNAKFETSGKGLIDLVSTKTPDDMYAILAKPDVNVTNAKDKDAMLPKIKQINEHVVETFHKHASALQTTEQASPSVDVAVEDARPLTVRKSCNNAKLDDFKPLGERGDSERPPTARDRPDDALWA
jgi:hypothetical protein